MFPIFTLHTIFGIQQFFANNFSTCRKNYDGEVFYIIIMMFAICMCFVFLLLLFCILLPTWIKKLKRRWRRRDLENQIQGMDGIIDQNPLIDDDERELGLGVDLTQEQIDERRRNLNQRQRSRVRRDDQRRRNTEQRQQLDELINLLNNELNAENEIDIENILDRRQRDRGMTQ